MSVSLVSLLSLSSSSSSPLPLPPPPAVEATTPGEVCSACLKLLAKVCERDRGHYYLLVAQAVLQCLAVPALRCGGDAAVSGCWLLMTACKDNVEIQDLLRVQGGLRLLLRLLDEEASTLETMVVGVAALNTTRVVEPVSASICILAAGCLACATKGNSQNQQALHELGGIDLLLRTLGTFLQSPAVVS